MNKDFLDLAFSYAEQAYGDNEVPIGAVIVRNNEVISYGFNKKEGENSVLGHAELIAIAEAEKKLGNWRLEECDMYVTLDPCPMFASAIKQARIKNVYSALNNADFNNLSLILEIFSTDRVNSSVNFVSNLDIERSKRILSDFFKKQRNK